MAKKVKKEFNPPLVILTDKDLAWIAEKLTEVDSLYTHFGLSLAEWTVIEKNNPRDYANVKRDTLLCWRRKQGYNATLANLVSVLAEPENYDAKLIEEIIQHFNRKLCETNYSHPVQESGDVEQPRAIHSLEDVNTSGEDYTPAPTTMDIIYQLNPEMNRYINMVSLMPYLNKYGILTSEARYNLNSNAKTPMEKVNYLLQHLEGKDDTTVRNFLQALKEASEHTGHIELCTLLRQRGVEI